MSDGHPRRIFTRAQLHELVWSEPLKTLGPRLGLSDVGLRKASLRADVPVPPRGYWARLRAGKKPRRIELPARGPGMDEEVEIGGDRYWSSRWSDEEILGPLPELPTFPESIEAVRERVQGKIGRVAVPRDLSGAHPAITRLLREDDDRRARLGDSRVTYDWEKKPRFDPPASRRPLRLMNGLFLGVLRAGGRSSFYDDAATEAVICVNDQRVHVKLAPVAKLKSRAKSSKLHEPLGLSILAGETERAGWSDGLAGRLERQMREIVIEIITTAEIQYRESRARIHEWRVEAKAQLEQELRKRAEEEARKRRERETAEAKARVDRLLQEAMLLRQATDIRTYVDAVERLTSGDRVIDPEALSSWRSWALEQADRIDPVRSRAFLSALGSTTPLLPDAQTRG